MVNLTMMVWRMPKVALLKLQNGAVLQCMAVSFPEGLADTYMVQADGTEESGAERLKRLPDILCGKYFSGLPVTRCVI
jgi:hypothetical protein